MNAVDLVPEPDLAEVARTRLLNALRAIDPERLSEAGLAALLKVLDDLERSLDGLAAAEE